MDREQFRQEILDGQNQLINSRIWRFMSEEQQKLTLAAHAAFADNDNTTNTFLDKDLAYFNRQGVENVELHDPTPEQLHALGCNLAMYHQLVAIWADHLLGRVGG